MARTRPRQHNAYHAQTSPITATATMSKKNSSNHAAPQNLSVDGLAKWERRLYEVDSLEIQPKLNEFYRKGVHKERFRFREGAPVVSLHQGFYHSATVFRYYHSALPESFFPAGTKMENVPADMWIPTHELKFTTWAAKYNEEAPENEIISRVPSELCHVMGLLYAHEWNTFLGTKYGLDPADCGRSAWFLTEENYTELEQEWQRMTGNSLDFTTFCGGRKNSEKGSPAASDESQREPAPAKKKASKSSA